MKHELKRIVPAAIISLLWSITAWSRTFNPSHNLEVTILVFAMTLLTAACCYVFIFRPLTEIFCNYLEENKK